MLEEEISVLIVEDEEPIRKFIGINLGRNGFKVNEAESGERAVELIKTINPRVIVLDIMLGGIDGYEVCKRAREVNKDVIIIMLTAKSLDMDKIMGLELGADDYMVKPFNPLELVARIRAILRRTSKENDNDKSEDEIMFRELLLDSKAQKFYKNKNEIDLTPTEFSIMKLLMSNCKKAFSRDEILNHIWGENYFGDVKTVDVHIRRLREKIETVPSTPDYIETVWGLGYRLKGDSR
jgi:DNA-binding response OmpR family regulator